MEIIDQHDAAFPSSISRFGLCLSLTPKWRMRSEGSMKVRPTVMVADDPEIEGNARTSWGIAQRWRATPEIRHRHDDVGSGRRFAGELDADALAHLVDVSCPRRRKSGLAK